jgi:type 1 glutamine amidotransferase/mono/diheme cytochrome c family protein
MVEVARVRGRVEITRKCWCLILCGICLPGVLLSAERPGTKKVVLIAGPKSHGPVGNGIHDYPWSVRLLKVMLDNSNVRDKLRVEYHLDGWPQDPATLDDADTIMVISDGRDGDKYQEAPHLQDPVKVAWIEKQIKRGCGFMTFHFSTFAPDSQARRILNWSGGYFDWETDGERKWYSAIKTEDTRVTLPHAGHPVCRGITPFPLRDEFYFNIRFQQGDDRLKGILEVPSLPGREPDGRLVAWAREREDGGRGFGTTCGHFYDNWKNPSFRKLILNAIAWTAGLDVPDGGVEAAFYEHQQIRLALAGISATGQAKEEKPIRVLVVTGHQYPGHKWQLTTPVIKAALERDPRLHVNVTENVEDLGAEKIRQFDLLVLNYCNWETEGLSDEAKAGFTRFLASGGGLILVHFSNGAFHFSLPGAEGSDWPEYRKICRRVWDHSEGKSGHDAYGKFQVRIHDRKHPITQGMKDFETIDELYFRQQGKEPIHVLATARSGVTGKDEPIAFVYEYGQGRVMQTVLGHDAESLRVEGVGELLRRSAAWIARRKQLPEELLNDAATEKPESENQGQRPGALLYYVDTVQPPPPERPGRLPREVRDRLAPGLLARFAAAGEDDYSDARATRLAAISLAAGQPATPFLQAGPFRVSMKGYLKIRLQEEFQFQLIGKGELKLLVNNKQVLQHTGQVVSVALNKGYNEIEILYNSPAEGDAACMLKWAGDEFDMEAIPPTVLFFDSQDEFLARASQERMGRELYARNHCRACHRFPAGQAPAGGGMPELARRAPSLVAAGNRLTGDWIRRWLEDPAVLRNDVTMPGMFHRFKDHERRQAINDVTAFLQTLVPGDAAPADGGDVAMGELLFEELGCISCHRLTQPEKEDYFARTSLWFAGVKYRKGAMAAFLQAPRAHYAWSRMPDFRLDPKQAGALAAFIRSRVEPAPERDGEPAGNAAQGKQLVVTLGCAACHELGEEKKKTMPAVVSPFGGRASHGCMAVERDVKLPAFTWGDGDHAALRAFLATGGESLARSTPVESMSRSIKELRCVACHTRDDRYADWPEVLFEEGISGHPPENVPLLTWSGEKLRVDWMEQLFAGTLAYKPRPWLKARMPSFPARGAVIAAGLAAEHGLSQIPSGGPKPLDGDIEIAKRLTGKDGGLDCRQCHAMGAEILKMENEAYGVSFGYIRHRLRYDHYQRWMINPQRFNPATKMPRYSPDRQSTVIKHIFEGDARRQFDSLWHYLDTTRAPTTRTVPPKN